MARELWIYAHGGLCNRWRALCSALAVCQRDDRRLVVCWPPEKGGTKFSEGFLSPQASFSDLWSNDWAQVSAEAWRALGSLTVPWEESPGEAHRVKVSHFSFFCTALIGDIGQYAEQFTPSEPVQALIDNLLPTIDEAEHIVGVSIRTIRAHPVTSERSPVSSFIDNLSAYFQRFPQAEVFVSAEEEWVISLLLEHFPERIFHYQQNPYEWHSKESMQKALADLYLLARTDNIIGSQHSSFSAMAHTLKTGAVYQFTSPGCDIRPEFSKEA